MLRQAKATDDACSDGVTGLDPGAGWPGCARLHRCRHRRIERPSRQTNEVEAKHHALARRLRDRRDDIMRFAYDLRVPFDNNGSERDLRMVKLRQRISGTIQISQGALYFVTNRSILKPASNKARTPYIFSSHCSKAASSYPHPPDGLLPIKLRKVHAETFCRQPSCNGRPSC